ncbi:MAG: hypothetical protein V8Q54_05350 [Alistipes senegalensis]
MWIGRIDSEGVHPITEGAYITLSNLRAGGELYYGSIASGKDQAHCDDLTDGREYRITTSAYGSFSPAPAGGRVLLTTYDRRGYRVTEQAADSALIPVAPSRLVAQPRQSSPRRRWDVVNLDTVRFDAADSRMQRDSFRTKRYRKVPNLINVHSWMPLAFNPFAAVDEHVIDLNLGFTLLSQNLLSNTEAYASYGGNRSEGSLVNLGVRYFGLGVRFDLDASYGGNQLFYSLGQYNRQTGKYQISRALRPTNTTPWWGCRPRCRSISSRATSYAPALRLDGLDDSNGMVANMREIELCQGGLISNIQHIGFRKGLHKLSFGVGFSDQVRMSHRDFAPRWGYTLSTNYTFNPANSHFSDLISSGCRLTCRDSCATIR